MWPLTAYAVDPIVLPALLVVAGSVVLVLSRPEYGIALVLVLAPEFNLRVGPTSLKFLLYAISFAVLVYGLLVARADVQRAPRSLSLGIAVFVVAGIASAAFGLDPARSIGRVVMLLAAASLYVAVLTVCRDRRQLFVVTAGALGGLFLAGAHGLAQQFTGFRAEFAIVASGEVLGRVQGSFGHPNEFGGYLAVLIPLALVVAVSRDVSLRTRVLAFAALAVALPALSYTYARGPIAALAAGILVWVAVIRPRFLLPVAAAVVFGALLLVPPALEERFERTSTGSGVALRGDIWAGAVEIYSEHPFFGVGLNNFSEAYEQLPTELPGGGQRRLLHTSQVLIPPFAENLYLHVLAEEGIVGLAALLALMAGALLTVYRGSRLGDAGGRAVSFGIGAAVCTLLAHGIVQVTLFTETVLPVFALLAVAARFVTIEWFAPPVRVEPADVGGT